MTAEAVARQWRNELGAPHTKQARARGELIELEQCVPCGNVKGYADYHLCRDGQISIYQIAVDRRLHRRGHGTRLLNAVIAACPGATSVLAKCPADIEANGWYERRGFVLAGTETTKSGRILNVWRLTL